MALDPQAVRLQLERLAASPHLVNSAQLCRFPRHVVERTLAGEAATLKESLLGTEVFDRGIRYDPRTDPVVRVEARRLRSKLEAYYASGETAGELIIRLPKGSYAPVFEHRAAPDKQPSRTSPRWLMAGSALCLAVAAGGYFWLSRTAPGLKTLAALPLMNLGGDPETEYFADGLTDELIDILGRMEGLRVVARSSVYQYKGKLGDTREIGRQLRADILLVGSVRKQGPRVRVSAQLVDASNGYELWSQTFERAWSEVFEMKDQMASAIAARLRTRPDRARPNRQPKNLEAYNLYLKGRYYWNKRTVAGFEAATSAFREAIEKDPDYAAAWAGLADSYSMLGFLNAQPPIQIREKAEVASRKALQLDDTLPEAHVAQGNIRAVYDWDWEKAERSFRRASELDPNSALAHYGLSKVLASLGRLEEALARMRRARDLDPLSLIIASSLAWELGAARRYQEGDEAFRAAIALDPNFIWTYSLHSWSLEARGRFPEAVAELNKAVALSGSATLALGELAHALGRNGQTGEAGRILERLLEEARRHYVSPFDLARAYEGLGRRDEAMAAMSRACDERSPIIVFLKVDPVFDPLRADPRFRQLLRRIHLE
jgi:serine/threonine-protein kinase